MAAKRDAYPEKTTTSDESITISIFVETWQRMIIARVSQCALHAWSPHPAHDSLDTRLKYEQKCRALRIRRGSESGVERN